MQTTLAKRFVPCHHQELQRYPRLHAQLIEVVSELLRERLGPTSEYVQSLISIQAAYINTNHPDFVKGSAVAAQESARISREKRLIQQVDAAGDHGSGASSDRRNNGASGSVEEEGGEQSGSSPEDEDDHGYLVPNGRGGGGKTASEGGRGGAHDRQRSVSSTVHDRALNGPSFAAGPSSVATNHQRHSGQQHQHHQQNSMTSPLRTHSPMPGYANLSGHHDRNASAKESFLNYFFGGNPAHGELSGSSAAAAAARMGAGGGGGGGLLGGAGGAEPFGRENPLTGRKGLEGNAAAFEMKSLDKHLEPVRGLFPFPAWRVLEQTR